jgi:hypothetical protein
MNKGNVERFAEIIGGDGDWSMVKRKELLVRTIDRVTADGASFITSINADGLFVVSIALGTMTYTGVHADIAKACTLAFGSYLDDINLPSHKMKSLVDRVAQVMMHVSRNDRGVEFYSSYTFTLKNDLYEGEAMLYTESRNIRADELFLKRLLAYVITTISAHDEVSYDLTSTHFTFQVGKAMDNPGLHTIFSYDDPARYLECAFGLATLYLEWLGGLPWSDTYDRSFVRAEG